MSYRNPQIIVDNSGQIWGKAISQIGQNATNTLNAYTAIKRKANAAAVKQREANQLIHNRSNQVANDMINSSKERLKEPSTVDLFVATATAMAETGEGNSVDVNGTTYTIGAIDAQTQLAINTNLTKDQRKAFSQVVTQFKQYQTSMIKNGADVIAGLDPLKNSKTGAIGTEYDYQGQGKDGVNSQMSAYALSNMALAGVKTKKTYTREKGKQRNSYQDMLNLTHEIDLEDDTFKAWEKAGMLSREDLVISKDGKTGTMTWSRDMNRWSEYGNLIVPIVTLGTGNALQETGFEDKSGYPTGKGYLKDPIVTTRRVDGGTMELKERHFDASTLLNNVGYSGLNKANAQSILTLPADQQVKHITNKLNWGGTIIDQNKWASSEPKAQAEFLELQKFEKDLGKMIGAGKSTDFMTREATPEDVESYAKAGKEINLGQTLYYSNIGKEEFKQTPGGSGGNNNNPPPTAQLTVGEEIDSIFSDVKNVVGSSGMGVNASYNEDTKVVRLEDGKKLALIELDNQLFFARKVILARDGNNDKSRALIKQMQKEIRERYAKSPEGILEGDPFPGLTQEYDNDGNPLNPFTTVNQKK